MKILVTGGAGFIGSALVRYLINKTDHAVINLDKLTYAASLSSVEEVSASSRYRFVQADICDRPIITALLQDTQPDAIMHLAAESHVDRSIDGPSSFIQTNVVGTFVLLEAARAYWSNLAALRQDRFRFLHVSTDEVYGSLGPVGAFSETTPYAPNSPYSASKAAADHLVRAWHHTYGFPVITTNCSNNYGPYHFPEKMIPLMILNALEGKSLPIYGKGNNIRDWLFVDDHVGALYTVLTEAKIGETYNIGGRAERTNLQVVQEICRLLDELAPTQTDRSALITFVPDRPGHDARYAMDINKIQRELGWSPTETFESGLRRTVAWYLTNTWWWEPIRRQRYDGARLGLGTRETR